MKERVSSTRQDLDRFDLAILKSLQVDNRMPQRLIAKSVGLSAPAVQRRIRRLEASGVIQANVAVVDPLRVGQAITLLVAVEMESERTQVFDAAKRSFAAAEEKRFRTFVAMDRVKVGLTVPLGPGESR